MTISMPLANTSNLMVVTIDNYITAEGRIFEANNWLYTQNGKHLLGKRGHDQTVWVVFDCRGFWR